METLNKDEIKFLEARKRMKEIKGFYIHLAVYLFVNLIVLIQFLMKIAPNSDLKTGFNFYTGFLWGLVIIIHAISIFLPSITNWERKKTEELMKQEQKFKHHGRY